jgi:hypothetical protein
VCIENSFDCTGERAEENRSIGKLHLLSYLEENQNKYEDFSLLPVIR